MEGPFNVWVERIDGSEPRRCVAVSVSRTVADQCVGALLTNLVDEWAVTVEGSGRGPSADDL